MKKGILHKIFLFSLLTIATSASAQIIHTIGGTGVGSFSGNGGPASAATFFNPGPLAIDNLGDLYIGDMSNNCIRKITKSSGIINTPTGAGTLSFPVGIAVDAAKSIYVAEWTANQISKITAGGVYTVIAGTGTAGYSGDNGQAALAELNMPYDVELDPSGNNLYVADAINCSIRKIDLTSGIITTIAGTGVYGYNGDSIPATSATLAAPSSLAVDTAGNIYILDKDNARIRKIDIATGLIYTIAGTGTSGYTGDGALATAATMSWQCYGLAVDVARNIYFSDTDNNCIRKITYATGIINTIAGTGTAGFSGDNGLATLAQLDGPRGISIDGSNTLYFADQNNNRIRKITPDGTLSISSLIGNQNAFSMFPNPAANLLTISSPSTNSELTITDPTGKTVYQQQLQSIKQVDVDVRKFSGGFYIVKMIASGSMQTQKLLIAH